MKLACYQKKEAAISVLRSATHKAEKVSELP